MNWKARIRNRAFWLTIVPAVLLVVQAVAALFGWSLDLAEMQDRIIAVVDAVFTVLVILGIVNDPTTAGFVDSERAKGYEQPWKDEE